MQIHKPACRHSPKLRSMMSSSVRPPARHLPQPAPARLQGVKEHSFAWDLNFEGTSPPVLLLPLKLYEGGFPKAKRVIGLPMARFSAKLIPSWLVAIRIRTTTAPAQWSDIARLERLDKFDHATALCRVGHASVCGTEIVRHVGGVGRARNDCRNGRIANQILKEELRPAGGVKIPCPLRQRLAAHCTQETAASHRNCRKHGCFQIGGERQNPAFRRAIVDRAIDLHEIGLLAP